MENERILIIQFQLTRFKVLAILTALFICFHPKILGSEQLTLTTYYPSPYGGYAKLLTTDQTVLARDAGRVGIREANPERELHVSGSGQIRLGRGSVATNDTRGVYWHDNAAYGIYRESGAWSHPYPDLRIAFHTGISLGAHENYNGVRFFEDYDMKASELVMSVNDTSTGGKGNVYVKNRLGINRKNPSHPLDVNGNVRITNGILYGLCYTRSYRENVASSSGAGYKVYGHYGDGVPKVWGFLAKSGEDDVGKYITLGQDWNGTMICCRIDY